MAGRPCLDYCNQQRILIAVTFYVNHLLDMAGCSPFIPQLLSGTAVKPGVAGFQSFLQTLPVHISQHQHFSRILFLNNSQENLTFLKIIFHIYHVQFLLTGISCSLKCSFTCSTVSSRKWNREAARAASAPVFSKTSEKCSSFPQPPLAITVIDNRSQTAWNSSRSLSYRPYSSTICTC